MALLAALAMPADAVAERRNFIGGSDANTIMSGNADRIIRLWREKRGEIAPEDLSGNLAVQMGSFTEPFNVAWYEKQTGEEVEPGGRPIVWIRHRFMRASLDGIAVDDLGTRRVFEAKHCGTRNTDAELFARYVPQLTHNCLCAGLEGAVLSIFKGNGDWCLMEYALDEAYAAALIESEHRFWECVQTGEPPAPLPPPPAPKPKGVKAYSMEGSNEWASHAADYIETQLAADRHEIAKRALKELVPDDASTCSGHGITINRTKAGALRFASAGE